MNRLLACVFSVALGLWSGEALAGSTCGSSSSGGSGGSSGSSGGSGGSSSGGGGDGGSGISGSEGAPACKDESEIVGARACNGYRFGRAWDAGRSAPWTLGIEVGVLHLNLTGLGLRGEAVHNDNVYRYDNEGAGHRLAGSFSLRITRFVSRRFYIGSAGLIGVSGSEQPIAGDSHVRVVSAVALGGHLIAGVAVPLGERGQLRAEALVGGRALLVDVESQEGACVVTQSHGAGQWTVAGRVALDVYLSHHTSVGAYLGYEALQREGQGGLRVTLHTRSHDNQPAR